MRSGRMASSIAWVPLILSRKEQAMSSTLVVVILVVLLLGVLPAWPHSRTWGYYPSGGLGLVVVILMVLLLMGRI